MSQSGNPYKKFQTHWPRFFFRETIWWIETKIWGKFTSQWCSKQGNLQHKKKKKWCRHHHLLPSVHDGTHDPTNPQYRCTFRLDFFLGLRWDNRDKRVINICKSLYYFKSISTQKSYIWEVKGKRKEKDRSSVLKARVHLCVANP